jgi:hypothetical protein
LGRFTLRIAALLIIAVAGIVAIVVLKTEAEKTRYAITYLPGGGRLGDKIVTYLKAKYLAQKYNVPLIFFPLNYTHQFAMSTLEPKKQKFDEVSADRVIQIYSDTDLAFLLKKKFPGAKKILFLCGYNTSLQAGKDFGEGLEIINLYTVQNKQFGDNVKRMLTPTRTVTIPELPKDRITVAVHIRKGGGYDAPLKAQQYFNVGLPVTYSIIDVRKDTIANFPTFNMATTPYTDFPEALKWTVEHAFTEKVPPEQFYVDQIKKLSEMLGDAPLYVHIFTDDKAPLELLARIQAHVNKSNIAFGTRKTENVHNVNIVDDMYAMSKFDCLIRSWSYFSWVSQIMGDHKIVIYPGQGHVYWINKEILFVDNVKVFLREPRTDDPRWELFKHVQWPKTNTVEARKIAVEEPVDIVPQLFEAVEHNDLVALKALLQQGYDIHIRGFRNNTLLHTAAENGYEAMVLFLLQKGIPVNEANACNETPLYLAVLNKHKGVVKILMEHGADDAVQNINRNNAVDVVVKRFGASLPYKEIAALLRATPTPEI